MGTGWVILIWTVTIIEWVALAFGLYRSWKKGARKKAK